MWLPRLSNPLCRILSTGAAGASPLAFFRAPTPWCRDEPPPPPPHIRFHRRDAREYRQGGARPVRRCRGGAAFLADRSFGIPLRLHHCRGGSEPVGTASARSRGVRRVVVLAAFVHPLMPNLIHRGGRRVSPCLFPRADAMVPR